MLLVAALLGLLLFLSKRENERNAESMGFDRHYKYFPEEATIDMTFEQPMPAELFLAKKTPIIIRFFRDVNTMANVIVSRNVPTEPEGQEPPCETVSISVKALDGLARSKGEGTCTLELSSKSSCNAIRFADWTLFATYSPQIDGKPAIFLTALDAIPTAEELAPLQNTPENIWRIDNKFWATRISLP